MRPIDRLAIVIVFCFAWAMPLAAQQIAVTNAASYAKHGLPNGGIAQGGLFVVFGERMGPLQIVHANPWPFPLILAGTSVEVEVGGHITSCFLVYTSSLQAAAILPSETPIGEGTVRVRHLGVVVGSGPISVVAHSFGVFTTRQSGSGQAVATNPRADAELYSIANSAEPGDFIDIWGTGLGAVGFNDEGQPEVRDLDYDVRVLVAGVDVPVVYAGRSGCCSAVDIVRIVTPDITGCFLPLTIFVDGVPANYGSVAIDPSGEACEYDSLFGPLDVGALHQGEERATGSIQLVQVNTLEADPDGVNVSDELLRSFESARAVYERTSVPDPSRLEDVQAVSTIGACSVMPANSSAILSRPRLDAGEPLELFRPLALSAQLTKQPDGTFYATLFDHVGSPDEESVTGFFQPGLQRIVAPGGLDVAAHEAEIELPSELLWLNRKEIGTVIKRDEPPVFRYEASDYDFVEIKGFASLTDSGGVDIWFACAADASAGSFTVPPDVLASLPDTPLSSEDGRFGTGSLTVTGYKIVPFQVGGTVGNTITFVSSVTQQDVDFN